MSVADDVGSGERTVFSWLTADTPQCASVHLDSAAGRGRESWVRSGSPLLWATRDGRSRFCFGAVNAPEPSPTSPGPPAGRGFATTRWSVVLRAGGASPEQAQAALEQLCRDDWYPLYDYARRKGHGPEDASDLTQDFFAKLLANDFAQGLSPEGGRFGSFRLTALNRFLVDEWRRSKSLKRGGDTFTTSLETLISERGEAGYLGEAGQLESAEHLFQRAWAETLFARVLRRLPTAERFGPTKSASASPAYAL